MMRIIRSLTVAAVAACTVMPAFAEDVAPTTVALDGQVIAQAPSTAVAIPPVTDDQRHKLAALRDQYELDTAMKKAQLHVSQRQLRSLLGETTVDKQAALSLQGKINGLKADLATARLNLRLAASDVFTAEQRAAFKSHRRHRGHHRGGCFGGGCGGHKAGPGFKHHGGKFSLAPSVITDGATAPSASQT